MSDAAVVKPDATYQDVLDAPPGMVAEIVNGVFHLHAQPAPPHIEVQSGLAEVLRPPFQRGKGGPGGWWIVAEPELQFGDPDSGTLVPDLAGWRRERLPKLPRTWSELSVAPDWVCEILSPATMRLDRVEKMPVYASEGVGWLWLIDPLARTLEVFQLLDGRWTLAAAHGGDSELPVAPFDAISLVLPDLWLPGLEDDDGENLE